MISLKPPKDLTNLSVRINKKVSHCWAIIVLCVRDSTIIQFFFYNIFEIQQTCNWESLSCQ